MTQICNKCNHLRDLEDFTKEKKKDGSFYIRKICRRCRNKQRREHQKENNYHSNKYWAMSEEDRKIYINKKSLQNQHRLKTNPESLKKKKEYEKTDKGIYNRYRNDCNRRARLTRNIKMLISFVQFQVLINDNCFYCDKENCRGVDRVDSAESYTMDNCNPCCRMCNQMKSNLSHEEFISHIKQILRNRL